MEATRIVAPDEQGFSEAASIILSGGVVGMPTETVYGLAGLASRQDSLAKIFSVKERPTFDPLILHVHVDIGKMILPQLATWADLSGFSAEAKKRLEATLHAFWPGPLTVVLPKTREVPDLATSGLPTVAIRMPRHAVAMGLIQRVGAPLAAPSANRFGRISPTRASHVADELGGRIPLILDGGPCTVGIESTVFAAYPDGTASLLRPGGTPQEAITQYVTWVAPKPATGSGQAAPGMLASHYSPQKPLVLFEGRIQTAEDSKVRRWFADLDGATPGVLLLGGDPDEVSARIKRLTGAHAVVLSLSERGDAVEAAQKLFLSLRALDSSRATRLYAESYPDSGLQGLEHAIADRLRRAAK